MNFKKHSKFIITFVALFFFYALIQGSFSIYRELKNDSIDLSILDPSSSFEITFYPENGESEFSIRKSYGDTLGTLTTPEKTGYTFDGWYTAADGGTEVTASTLVTGTARYYAHWLLDLTVNFDANGGTVSPSSKTVAQGRAVGELPVPQYSDHTFLGWYTAADGGTEVTEATIVSSAGTFYYAHWSYDLDYLQYVFYIPGECNFTSSGLANGANGNCVSTINPTGSNIDYTESTLSAKKYIDTGIALYNATNHDLDYEIGFTIGNYVANSNPNQSTIFNTKLETTGYPGLVFRKNGNSNFELASRKTSSSNEQALFPNSSVTSFRIFRINNEISYSLNGGDRVFLNNLTQYNPVFDLIAWFGAAPANAAATSAQRFFIGTLSNMYIKLEPDVSQTANVTFDLNYPNAPEPTDQEVVQGSAIGHLDTPTRTGYTFVGWFTSDSGGTQINENTLINDDITFYAHWAENITVTFDANGGSVSPNSKTFGTGMAIGELPTPEYPGHAFVGWYLDNTWATQVTESTVFNSTTSIVARWVENITVTFNANGGTVSPNSKSFSPGTAIGELPTPEYPGYTFIGWYLDNTWATGVTESTVFNSTTSIVARWVENITVTFDANGGSVSPNSKTFSPGTAIGELPTPEYPGHTFKGWYIDNTWATEVTTSTVFNSTTSIVAKWVQNITISFDADGGTASFNSKSIEPGTAIGELPTATNGDEIFDGWYLDNGLYDTEITEQTVANTSLNVIAKWVSVKYVAEVNGTLYETLDRAIADVPLTGVKTTVTLLDDVSLSSEISIDAAQNVELDLQNFTIDVSSSTMFMNSGTLHIKNGTLLSTSPENGTTGFIIDNLRNSILNISGGLLRNTGTNIIMNAGTINMTGGRLETTNNSAAINNNQYGVMTMSAGEIVASSTTKGQAIYNNKGTLTISGTAYLENKSQPVGGSGRACVHNNAGTVTILGGTIISKANAGVKNNDTMTIGSDDGNISTTSPVIQGHTYGLETVSGKTVYIYDGVFRGGAGSNPKKAISNESYTSHGSYTITHTTETIGSVTYDVAYLVDPSI